jgi:hypothetical protein
VLHKELTSHQHGVRMFERRDFRILFIRIFQALFGTVIFILISFVLCDLPYFHDK